MLLPKRVKYRKAQRGRMRGISTSCNELNYGEYGLLALECCWLTNRQIEAARIVLAKSSKKGGKVWIRGFPDKPVTKKPAETRMGKGKGAPEYWVCVVKPGRVMFEVGGISAKEAEEALLQASYKLPIKTRIISRQKEGM